MEQPTFSQRSGFAPPDAEITIRNEAPGWLRDLVISLAQDAGIGVSDERDILCQLLLESPDSNNWSAGNIEREARDLIWKADWFQVYDYIEILADRLGRRYGGNQYETFVKKLNEAFKRKGIGWQITDAKIEVRGPEAFEQIVRDAHATLQATGRQVAQNEIHQALADLSKRPDPDVTGAIQHAMAALECVARDVTGDPKSTLGEIVKKHPGILPPPLDTALSKLWGFASDQARHLRENQATDIKEAELLVGLAGSIATYLAKKFNQGT